MNDSIMSIVGETAFRTCLRQSRNSMTPGSSPTKNPPPAATQSRMSGVPELERIMTKFARDPDDCVFLHPDDRRNYTAEEVDALKRRNFETKLFMTATPCAGDTVFVRTHHTDNLKHASHFNYIRDYIKAAHATRVQTCAKATLTTLLTMCFDLSASDYYTFAISIASGLSKYGENTEFEFHDGMVASLEEVDAVRGKFCLLMDVLFSKMSTKKFLLDDKQSNIFRLVHCNVKYGKDKSARMAAFFSFTLQITLTAYVALHQRNSSDNEAEWNIKMLALSVFTFCYSIMVAMATISDTLKAYELVFKEFSVLMMMDVIINILIPLALSVFGFILILCEKDYINAVLNCSALLFIPEIDDQLPQILGYREDDIIKNFLITESMEDFDDVMNMPEDEYTTIECARRNLVCGLQFGDFYITNMPEQGTNAQEGLIFQPYQVTESIDGIQIDPSTTITPDCLLCGIEWQYTTGFPNSTRPRVGSLTLTKIDGTVVKIERKKDPSGKVGIHPKENPNPNQLKGLFIITTFQMSEDVIKLRVCGSHNKKNFLKAFDYYSLWDVTDEARAAIIQILPTRRRDVY